MNKVVYVSRSGNTKKVAGAVAKGASAKAVSVEEANLSKPVNILFVGGSIYAGKIDGKLRDFLSALRKDQVKIVAVFGTAASKKSALPEVKAILEPKGILVSDDAFQCKGKFMMVGSGHPNVEDLKHAEVFAKRICEDNSHE